MASYSQVTYKRYNPTNTSWEIYYFKTTAGSVIESTTKKFLTPAMTINNKVLFDGPVTLTGTDIGLGSPDGGEDLPQVNSISEALVEAFSSIDQINTKINGDLLKKTHITNTINADNNQDESHVTSPKAVYSYVNDLLDNTIKPLINPSMEFKGVWSTTTSLPSGAKKGDTYKLGANIGSMHKGDLLIAVKDGPSTALSAIDDGTNWSIIHGEADTNTADTWRAIQVNGVQKIASGISTGALNFKDGNNTTVTYDGGIKINVDLSALQDITDRIDDIDADVIALKTRKANKVFVGNSAPTTGMIENDIWIDTTGAVAV